MFCVNDAQAVKSISHLPNQQMSCKMSAMATTAQVKNLYGCIQAERFLTGLNVLKGMRGGKVPPYITPRAATAARMQRQLSFFGSLFFRRSPKTR